MGAAIDAFGLMIESIKRNPVLVAGALVVVLFSAFATAVSQIPLLGLLFAILFFFVEPFFTGGFLGMVDDAVDGTTELRDFVDHGREHFVSLLAARLVVAVPTLVYAVLVMVVGGVVLFTRSRPEAMPARAGASDLGLLVEFAKVYPAVTAVVLVGTLVYLVPLVVVQFYAAAIVVADADALESFRYSYRLAKAHPVSVLGYTAATFAIGLIGLLPRLARSTAEGMLTAESSLLAAMLGAFVVYMVAFVLVNWVVTLVGRTYYISFVRDVTNTA